MATERVCQVEPGGLAFTSTRVGPFFFVFLPAMTRGAAAAGDFASREGDADTCMTSLKRRETPACRHGDSETLHTRCRRRVHE